jgi:hypothetical protein
MPPEPDDLDEDYVDDDEPVEDPEDEEDESPEPEEDDEPLAAEDEDEEPPAPAPRAQRKPFKQRVEEVAARMVEDRMRDVEARLRPTDAQESTAQRNARLAEMEPWERTEYLVNERLGRLEYEGQDRIDKIDFANLVRERPAMARFKDEVDRRLSSMRGNGYNASREVILQQILGERALANAGRATGRAARTAATNRERQTTRPGAARSDTAATDRRGTGRVARDRRLENEPL